MNNIPQGLLPIPELKSIEKKAFDLIENSPEEAYKMMNGIKQHIEDCLKREQDNLSRGGAILGAIAGALVPKARFLCALIGAFVGYKVTSNDVESALRKTEYFDIYEHVTYGMALCRQIIHEVNSVK